MGQNKIDQQGEQRMKAKYNKYDWKHSYID